MIEDVDPVRFRCGSPSSGGGVGRLPHSSLDDSGEERVGCVLDAQVGVEAVEPCRDAQHHHGKNLVHPVQLEPRQVRLDRTDDRPSPNQVATGRDVGYRLSRETQGRVSADSCEQSQTMRSPDLDRRVLH